MEVLHGFPLTLLLLLMNVGLSFGDLVPLERLHVLLLLILLDKLLEELLLLFLLQIKFLGNPLALFVHLDLELILSHAHALQLLDPLL